MKAVPLGLETFSAAIRISFPYGNTVDWFAVIVSLAAFMTLIKWKLDIIPVVLGASLLGLLFKTSF
jgi:hypothetical protein